MSKKSIGSYARDYVRKFGLHLVPIEPNRKFPRSADWGNKTLSDPTIAEAFYNAKPDWNMGVALGPSRMCALDIDCLESFTYICDAFGVDLNQMIKDYPTIEGSPLGRRIEFRVPEGVDLPYVKLNWRRESDPTGEKHKELLAKAREARNSGDDELASQYSEEAKQYAMYTVFELRSATDGSQKQNVYPPSIHPETGEPYRWVSQPRVDWPEPPQWLLTIWTLFERIKPQLMAACPWAIEEEIYKPKTKPDHRPKYNPSGGYQRVVSEYNSRHHIEQELLNLGYKRVGQRFLGPNSTTGLPGVVIFKDNRCWIHHASDPLCSDESGQPVSPFDLMCYYEFSGDYKAAVTKVAADMGIILDAPTYNAPTIDMETGEVLDDMPPPMFDAAPSAPSSSVRVDHHTPLPWADDNGRPRAHIENLEEILRRMSVVVRYNVIKKEEEILLPGKSFSMDNKANASLATIASECSLFKFPTDKLSDFLTVIADKNPYNPVITWITSKPWDGTPRLQALFDTVTSASPKELKEILMRRWLLSAIDAAFSPNGVSARGVLVFQGSQQMGKTRWFKRLVPEHMDITQEGMLLRPDDKDSVKQACSNWLVELGEIDATFKRSDIAQLKGFITKDRDIVRLPYARKESTFARRTVFFGSVNPREFLNDPTGNSRFWTIECTHIDHSHDLDMQQVWAEVYELYKEGERHILTKEEADLLNSSNDDYVALDPVEERVLAGLNWDADVAQWVWRSATQTLLDVGIQHPTKGCTMKAAKVIRDRNGDQSRRTGNGRLLLVPPLVSGF